jgi:hypothetical protein
MIFSLCIMGGLAVLAVGLFVLAVLGLAGGMRRTYELDRQGDESLRRILGSPERKPA